MKIAMLAPFEESVPPKKYGGTEVVIYNLITELVKTGHDVTLFGTGDSDVPCRVVSIFPKALRGVSPYDTDVKMRESAKWNGISKILIELQKQSYDIVHNHIGWRFCMFYQHVRPPFITTLHGPMNLPYQHVGYRAAPDLSYVSISDNQRKEAPDLQYVSTVYNGIDCALYPFSDTPDDNLLFLARFSPEKGAKEAIEIAKASNHRLILACKIDQADKDYYEANKHFIDGKQIHMIGEIGQKEKTKLLQSAKALLAPIQWEEPFGLYAVEAMACGTPVIGIARGSFPEIIQHKTTGFLGSTIEELSVAVGNIGSVSRKACRTWVESRFTKEIMAEGYLKAYSSVIAKHHT